MIVAPAIVQLCFVVTDLDAAIASWVDTRGAGPFFTRAPLPQDGPSSLPVEYRGAPSTLEMRGAMGQCGALQIELLQPMSAAPSVVTDLFAPGETGLHHVAMFAADFDAAVAEHGANGYPLNTQGSFGGDRFAFVDTRAALGFFTEIYEDGPALRELYRRIAAAADGWDGKQKTRPFEEALG